MSQRVFIGNIPPSYTSGDLRTFFSQYVERSRFKTFHFLKRLETESEKSGREGSSTSSDAMCGCAILGEDESVSSFLSQYHGKVWTDPQGRSLVSACIVTPVNNATNSNNQDEDGDKEQDGKTTGNNDASVNRRWKVGVVKKRHGRAVVAGKRGSTDAASASKRERTIRRELNPPGALPQGNVGTPTRVLQRLIADCKLPTRVLKQLHLHVPDNGFAVPFDYGDDNIEAKYLSRPDDHDLPEEWDRHVALNGDGSDKVKERHFEESRNVEVTWDKGSSGLVFYSDINYWDRVEGDEFDQKAADDWDVDFATEDKSTDKRDYRIKRTRSDRDSMASGHGDIGADDDEWARIERTREIQREMSRRGRPGPSLGGRDGGRRIRLPPPLKPSQATTLTAAGPIQSAPGASNTERHFESEKHSRGIGSAILAKHGWKPGDVLGQEHTRHRALTEPVKAREAAVAATRQGIGFDGPLPKGRPRTRSSKHNKP